MSVDLDQWMVSVSKRIRQEFIWKGKFEPSRAYILATRATERAAPLPKPTETILLAMQFRLEDRQPFADLIADHVRRTRALAYVFASEAWTTGETWTKRQVRRAREYGKTRSWEDLAGRGECLFFVYQQIATSNTVAKSAIITRDATGIPTLGEFKDSARVGGRFTGLMPEVS